jgi:hypothetical protein
MAKAAPEVSARLSAVVTFQYLVLQVFRNLYIVRLPGFPSP